MKSQRVCQKCYEDLKLENKYLSGRDFLQEGQGFKKIEMMGMSSKLVTLKVTPGFKGLSLKAGSDTITTPPLSLYGDHQIQNAALALMALKTSGLVTDLAAAAEGAATQRRSTPAADAMSEKAYHAIDDLVKTWKIGEYVHHIRHLKLLH